MTKKDIGKLVARTRKAKELSLYRINKETGVQRNQIEAIEKADKAYTIDSLLKTCSVLGITIHATCSS